MNYKQKYNEALERAKAWVENRCMPSDTNRQGVLEDIFPELKELEDEKLRKTLIEYFNAYPKDYYGELKKSHILAWLEKQGKKKHTWSKEDEKTLNEIFSVAARASLRKSTLFGKSYDYIKWQNFLKSLRPQNITVTDEELAQAKKDAYNDALDKIEYHSGEPTFDDGWSAAIWYLKKRNAQPQNTWKPSDEQMEALANALSLAKSCGEESAFDLRTLYEQLKKLKEE